MRKLIYLASFLFIGITYAQVTPQPTQTPTTNRTNTTMGTDRPTSYDIQETSNYTFNNQSYRFTPDEQGINISRMDNDVETPIGNLRRTTADGYYIMTSATDSDDISFGRFNEDGNFRSYRYDRDTDSIIEDEYTIDTPTDISGGQNRSGNMQNNNNQNLNNNTNNNNNNPVNNNRGNND